MSEGEEDNLFSAFSIEEEDTTVSKKKQIKTQIQTASILQTTAANTSQSIMSQGSPVAQDYASKELRTYHRGDFKVNVTGTLAPNALDFMNKIPMGLLEDMIRITIECCLTNRDNFKKVISPFIIRKAALNDFLVKNCYLDKELNFKLMTTVGYLFMAAGFEGTIGAQKAYADKYGGLSVMQWTLGKLNEKRRPIVHDFQKAHENGLFDNALAHVRGTLKRTCIETGNGEMKVYNLTAQESTMTLEDYLGGAVNLVPDDVGNFKTKEKY